MHPSLQSMHVTSWQRRQNKPPRQTPIAVDLSVEICIRLKCAVKIGLLRVQHVSVRASRRHGFSGEPASDVLPKPTEVLHGLSSTRTSARAHGNNRGAGRRLLRQSKRRTGGHTARPVGPWASGRRQGISAYVSTVPFAPGGVSARFGANWREVVDPPAGRQASARWQASDMEVLR